MSDVGRKDDAEKLRYELVPWESMDAVVRVLGFGAKKYAPDNWMKIERPHDRYVAAMLRHAVARARGEIFDPETGEPHVAHLVCCGLFLIWHDRRAAE